MTTAREYSYTLAVLRIYDPSKVHAGLRWRLEGDRVAFAINCSGAFWPGIDDAETIDPGDVPLLERCLDDLVLYDGEWYLGELFVARKRRLRPLSGWLDSVESHPVAALFIAAGPPRDIA